MSEQEILELQQKNSQVLAECQIKLESIMAIATSASQKEAEINAMNAKIIELKAQAENGNGSISAITQEAQNLKAQIDTHFQKSVELMANLNAKQQELETHYNGFIAKPSPQEQSKLEKVTSAYSKIIETGEGAEKLAGKMKEAEIIVFGDSEKNVNGLKAAIESYEAEIKGKKTEWENSYNALKEKIEGLMPGATSTGLAKAYQDQGLKYKTPYWLWSGVFLAMTSGMIAFAIYSLHDATSIADAFIKIITRIPFFVPAIWLAVFSSKQQSQSRRLQEEYAYKETLAKSYEGYKRELEKLPPSAEKNKMVEKLLNAMVTMAEYNPSQTLQMRHHNDRPPILSDLFKKGAKSDSTETK